MNKVGWGTVSHLLGKQTFKAILNESGCVFFVVSQQHQDASLPGVSYRDGNALALMIKSNNSIEVRLHEKFDRERVLRCINQLTELKSMSISYGMNKIR